jgi:hypothetical protein
MLVPNPCGVKLAAAVEEARTSGGEDKAKMITWPAWTKAASE